MEPVRLDFIVNDDIDKELAKIKQAIKGVGDESYTSFSRLTTESNKAFNSLSNGVRQQLVLVQQVIAQLRENEAAQASLILRLKEGIITSQEYANAQQGLVQQQAVLKEQISSLNIQLEREMQLSSGLKSELGGTKTSTDSLNGSFSSMLGFLIQNVSNIKDLYSGLKILRTSGATPWALAAAAAFTILKNAIESNSQAALTLKSKFSYIESLWENFKNTLKYQGVSFGDLFKGDFTNAVKKQFQAISAYTHIFDFASDAEGAFREQDRFNERLSLRADLMKVNNAKLSEYQNKLLNSNTSLEERSNILQKMVSLERENRSFKVDDLSGLYKIFRGKTGFSSYINKDQIETFDTSFQSLINGEQLTAEQQKKLILDVSTFAQSVKVGWDDTQKNQFKSFFMEALEINTEYYTNIERLKSLAEQKTVVEPFPFFTPPPKSQIQQLQEELNLRKQQYAQMEAFERGMGTEAAGQAYGELKKQGSDYVDYLSQLIETFKNKSDRTAGDNESLGYLFQEREAAKPQETFDPAPIQRELEMQKEYYKQDINAYIAYLNEKRALLESDRSEAGGQKRQLLDQALGGAEGDKQAKLDSLLQQYQNFATKMASIQSSYKSEEKLLNEAFNNASTVEEQQRISDALALRKDACNASLASLEAENQGFSKVLFGDLQNISKGALAKAIADAKHFIQEWKKQAGELSPETVAVLDKIEKGIDNASEKSKSDLPRDLQAAAQGLQSCADMAMVFDCSLGSVLQTSAEIAKGTADIATGVAQFGANPLQGATSIMSGISSIVSSVGKRIQENKKILGDYLQGLTETYSKELEYNSILRERLRLQQQLGETSLEYFSRLESELERQKTSVNSEYEEVWGKLMGEQYVSGTNYKHGTWFRKAKTWNEYGSLSGKSYEDIESLYTQDKLEGSAKILFERLKQLKEEGASVVEMMDQLKEEMKESWTGTTSSAIADSIVQGFMDGKRSAADFADNFQDLMRTAMMQAVKMKYLEGPLNQWYDRFAEASEGGLTEDKIAALREQYNQIIENAAREAENMDRILGLPAGTVDATREATASGIASMSQDTASELNGNFYALQYMTSNIDRNVTNIQSVLYLASDQWIRIEENTRYCRKLETIESNMASIRKDMQDINNKGILMRTR